MFVKLGKERGLEVRAGEQAFHVFEGDDGGLYIEGAGKQAIRAVISDEDGDAEIVGQWATLSLVSSEPEAES